VRFLVNLATADKTAGNAGEFEAPNEEGAVSLAKEKFGADFPVVLEVKPL